jgi:hypothetical protein
MHTIFQVLYMAKIYTSLAYIYVIEKKVCMACREARKHRESP